MKNLSAALIIESVNLGSANPWLLLLDINLPNGGGVLRLVKHNENITFQSNAYTAINFEFDYPKESSKGEIPMATLRISNVSRAIQSYLETYSGGKDVTITIRAVNSAHLAEDYAELEMTLDVLSSSADAYWATFSLGASNPMRHRFPPERYLADHCSYVRYFKGVECKYSGNTTSCEGTLEFCRSLGNSKNFGGVPGLSHTGVRLA